MNTIQFNRRDYAVLETVTRASGTWARINISTSDKPAYVWRLVPPCTAIVLWRPTIELPITELGFFKEGSKQPAIPDLLLHKSNVRIVLTLPEAA